MSKIRILPEQLANRIAAGEVVERPASVVKELLENCLDAGATRIEIEIEGSGTRLIRVIDNGEGMDEDDMLLCLERHGTSKIATDQDLAAISSLGFRGEAIPSIGSVSRMTITSRLHDAPLGARVVLDYGKVLKVHEIGCSRGTIFEIRNLFGNTPARRKFLRTSRTELAHIEEVVKSYALATSASRSSSIPGASDTRPSMACVPGSRGIRTSLSISASAVAFILRIDDREVLHFDERQSLPDRLRAILHYQGPFMEIGAIGSRDSDLAITGYLLPPDAIVAGSAGIRLLVNGRAVRDRMIIHGVAEGLRNFLMKGRNPAGLIHLRLPPEDVDVNVHPTKQEIRLRDSQAVHQMVSQAVEQAMQEYQKNLQSTLFRAAPLHQERPQPEPVPRPVPRQTNPPTASTLPFPSTPKTFSPEPSVAPNAAAPLQTAEPMAAALAPAPAPIATTQQAQPATKPHSHDLKVIGQYADLYIFCQADNGDLLVVDQHAAHERLLFEDLKRQFLQGHITSQTLLFPATVELSLAEAECVEHHAEEIRQMGFTIREFGGNSFIISAVPAMAGHGNPGELLVDVLARFGNGEEKNGKGSLLDDILASMACKAAVKAGDTLHPLEIDALLTRMARADLFSHCPHGRPVLKHFTATEVKKWFHRT